MTDTIDDLRAELAAAGIDPSQVQRGPDVTSWDEGTYVWAASVDGVVLRQLGRTRDDDRLEEFASEADVVIELRRRLLQPTRTIDADERAAVRERMQARAAETLARLEAGRD
ncbi:hypothetical protein CFI00_21720 [Nocardioides sp. S5]|uniref:hypothetical protein n=1 Tax=Nocardioides sp. S5 TaxID=2017486 RepID=UPI001A8CF671|nr:hypothetical protein [Nocardioides sp. S5]QSR33074.1 hypothetical protein CFI00_21720 [Nocardioides sp. S5]